MTFEVFENEVRLPGLGIGGYRSFPDLRLLSPFGKVTLLAGQNNVGKSNVIRFMEKYLTPNPVARDWDDEPRPTGEPIRLATAHRIDWAAYEEWASPNRERLDRFLNLKALRRTQDDLIWVVREQNSDRNIMGQGSGRLPWRIDQRWMQEMADEVAPARLTNLRNGVFSSTGGRPEDNITAVLDHLVPFQPPRVEVIRAFRQVTGSGAEADHSGGNLIETLADHQNPSVQERHKHEKFEAINRFLASVLEDSSVRIEVPAHRRYIMVHHGGMVFPLEDLGTGIHQVVIMAAAATLIDESLVCIEEPEINLHPILQRKFVRYLTDETSNQYVIATHSAHMLDYERASVIHVRKEGSATLVSPAATTHEVADVCADLGYRPSDILQSNAVIWVEGPSDRIYLNHWLRLLEPAHPFIENIHYSVMFYGGSNRNHLTGDDPLDDNTTDDLISLRRLNRHSMIVIDSDKTRPRGDRLDANKIRVRDEFDRDGLPGHAWITACRTIENYVPPDLLTRAVHAAHRRARYEPPTDKWADPLFARRSKSEERAILNKVRVAGEVIAIWDDQQPWLYDLRSEVKKVYDFIAAANPGARPHAP